ncbi:MAG: alpha-1,4-glucan--maltose-1-phosphate maltosyltransferase [Verrucomicrobiia bacterium]
MKMPASVVIENVVPSVSCGRHAVKRTIREPLVIEADIFKDGHDIMRARVKWRHHSSREWKSSPMVAGENDRWRGLALFSEVGPHEVTIEAWGDTWLSWQAEILKKLRAQIVDLRTEVEEGARLIEATAQRAKGGVRAQLRSYAARLRAASHRDIPALLDEPELAARMLQLPDLSQATEMSPVLPVYVDRERALFAAWYEFFPRSAEGRSDRGSTFRDCLGRVEDAKAMGFDVIYFPPIHPIGFTKRKGPNNSLTSKPGDPGVPYAIGSAAGGHMAVEPSLGTLEDFDWLVEEIGKRGMEVALDFAINCSPDHPYVKEHPEWFFHRPDGSIKYAENPPKKYEDIYPLNFHAPTWKALWAEMRDIILFWCAHRVRIFRVDNPHTKPVAFWEYLIAEVQAAYPDVIFLSEAFTKPKMMKALAKVGFTQSYTYFTWRNSPAELRQYLSELTTTEMKEYFRPNFFTNTPDILPFYLQQAGRAGFMVRVLLAATLSPVYGIYSGFELCENDALPGREEYKDSEKYQFKGRDWNRPGHIKDWIRAINKARRDEPALQLLCNLEFHPAENPHLLVYSKVSPCGRSRVFCVVNTDPHNVQSGHVEFPAERFGLASNESCRMEDLLLGEQYDWRPGWNFVSLDPNRARPAHLFRVARWVGGAGTSRRFA